MSDTLCDENFGFKVQVTDFVVFARKKSTRYNELKRRIPEITNIMLTKSLRELEADGLVERKILKSSPPKEILYSLTENAMELLPAMNEIYSWGAKQLKF